MPLKPFLFFFLGILGFTLGAQNTYQKATVIDSIPVAKTSNESFALYLPKSFSQDKPSSIVFIFEPAARSALGIRQFIPVSEKYGHILVCSNNSRNAPYERNFSIANHLFGHIFSQFNIKEDEMYISGFSGGSRLAAAIASLTNQFAGVVGCGAGFSGLQEHTPSAHAYNYVGLCGDRDMNYKEMLENKSYLNLVNFNSTLITFDGEHSWPPQEQLLRAFDWLYLQKLKHLNPAPTKTIVNHYNSDYEVLREFRKNGGLLFEAEQLERMIKDYKGVLKIDSLIQQYRSLVQSKQLKKQLSAVENALKIERKWMEKLDAQLTVDFKNPERVNWKWWKKELDKLDKLSQSEDAETQKMLFRIRFDLFARIFSRRNTLIHQQSEAQTKLIDGFSELLNPVSN